MYFFLYFLLGKFTGKSCDNLYRAGTDPKFGFKAISPTYIQLFFWKFGRGNMITQYHNSEVTKPKKKKRSL